MDTPLGRNRCDTCSTLSGLYDLWPLCRECLAPTCDHCDDPDSYDDGDGRPTTCCGRCAQPKSHVNPDRVRGEDDGTEYGHPNEVC
jgi:hypothetical protein